LINFKLKPINRINDQSTEANPEEESIDDGKFDETLDYEVAMLPIRIPTKKPPDKQLPASHSILARIFLNFENPKLFL